jgi:predicted nucleotidyltransferase
MELPKRIAGVDARKVREVFKTLLEGENKFVWKNGVPSVVPRKVTPDLIDASLNVSGAEAQRIHAALIAEGWIEPNKFVPTRRGMALAQHVDRSRISRTDAEKILDEVLDWADRINADAGTRVKLKAIYLFGSLERGEAEVGDIDLFVEFTTLDLGDELQPEDMDRENEMAEELTSISEYVSPSSELDRKMMSDVPSRQVFPRPSSGS